ncbi:hypothetical protein [Candidatus Nitronereus thalassa]|uniref:Uncharacterized protein n=1 Tax=Candidatus Nitronereus thalassa TaxID=3020898 RepID=A0ABU3K4R6_9BACT|nr:hypothetical protein [Candidatus Nitronereus thalassa]MDT7041373.1 hypothetical protein [Candidatus Nitronereus thalassa]
MPSVLVAVDEKVAGRLIVEDVLARPSTPVKLQARLVRDGPKGFVGLGGETITFRVHGQKAGSAVTDKDGRAILEFETHMRGNQKIVGEVETSSRVNPVSGLGNFASWERRKPILLVDVSTLLKGRRASSVGSPPDARTLGEADEDAPRELTKLGEFYYNIIYLWPGAEEHILLLRDWLTAHKFPPGITRTVPPEPSLLLAFIDNLKEGGWDHVEAGIGQTKGFADTLVKNRIKAVIFPDSLKNEKFPHRAKIISEWKDIRKHL